MLAMGGQVLRKAAEIHRCLSLFAFMLHGPWKPELFPWDLNTAGAENGREEGSARNPVTEAAAKVSEGVGLKMLRLKDDHLTRQ